MANGKAANESGDAQHFVVQWDFDYNGFRTHWTIWKATRKQFFPCRDSIPHFYQESLNGRHFVMPYCWAKFVSQTLHTDHDHHTKSPLIQKGIEFSSRLYAILNWNTARIWWCQISRHCEEHFYSMRTEWVCFVCNRSFSISMYKLHTLTPQWWFPSRGAYLSLYCERNKYKFWVDLTNLSRSDTVIMMFFNVTKVIVLNFNGYHIDGTGILTKIDKWFVLFTSISYITSRTNNMVKNMKAT